MLNTMEGILSWRHHSHIFVLNEKSLLLPLSLMFNKV